MPTFTDCDCEGCNSKVCMWHQFSGFDLSAQLGNMRLKKIVDNMDDFRSRLELVKAANSQIAISRSRVWELWKEYFGGRIGVGEMNSWKDLDEYGDIIMSETPPCIHYYISNYLPFLKLDNDNKIVVQKLGYVEKKNILFRWKKVYIDATCFFPNPGKLKLFIL